MFEIASRFCMSQTGRDICRSVVYILFGPSNLYKDDLLAKIINHIPAGSSYKQFIHYVQIAVAHRFQHYDHGIKMNLKIYGTPKPPEYNLTNVRAKVHILQGANDLLTQTENVPLLAKAMGCYPVAISHVPGFNHIDFIFGSNLDKIHKKIFKVSKIFY
ncbi:gastric triacylglycerol lipase-like [Contarinia nasturtii]|uniref:gastric triacylglycerol lipase-like n=1 Tax=Contarinia nasturtii TaxID=265458 RepID=UPI0012D451BA|nr:gastric triacylglycerol lipase-like [Contarinia nasturtii]